MVSIEIKADMSSFVVYGLCGGRINGWYTEFRTKSEAVRFLENRFRDYRLEDFSGYSANRMRNFIDNPTREKWEKWMDQLIAEEIEAAQDPKRTDGWCLRPHRTK